jgi:hypothetical protein
MRIAALAITGMLAACVAFPAAAAKKGPSQAVSATATCTQLKSECLSVDYGSGRFAYGCSFLGGGWAAPAPYCKNLCNFTWEQCMKSGFWEGRLLHRPAERR